MFTYIYILKNEKDRLLLKLSFLHPKSYKWKQKVVTRKH